MLTSINSQFRTELKKVHVGDDVAPKDLARFDELIDAYDHFTDWKFAVTQE